MKTKMKNIISTLIISLIVLNIQAQTEADALRYSMLTFGGTARYVGLSGAFGALGADFSTLSSNPAGIALYKRSELTFTPGFSINKFSSKYNNSQAEDFKLNINISNFGYVLSFKTKAGRQGDEAKGWKNFQFGMGFNRLNNFNMRSIVMGVNNKNSLLSEYADYANASGMLGDFDTRIAFDAALLYFDKLDSIWRNKAENGGVYQRKLVNSNGSMNEMVISFGGNYNDRLYVGATIGIPFINYEEESIYKEFDEEDTIKYFRNFTMTDNLKTTGTGVNLKLGIIMRITDFLRIGGAFHTPTYFYRMNDKYSKSIVANYDNGNQISAQSREEEFNYTLTTPMRAIGSIAFIIGKYGLISADYEYVDYSMARLQSNSDDFYSTNENIQNNFKFSNIIRAGAELKLDPVTFRGGYAYYGNPFKSSINNITAQTISGGFGIRSKYAFIDITYSRTFYKEDFYIYGRSYVNPAQAETVKNNVLVTLGLKF